MNLRKKIYFEGIELAFRADRNSDKTVSEPVSSTEQENQQASQPVADESINQFVCNKNT